MYTTRTDAKVAVDNSGVVDWEWGTHLRGREDDVLSALADYAYALQMPVETPLLAGFIRDALWQDPRDYDLDMADDWDPDAIPMDARVGESLNARYELTKAD